MVYTREKAIMLDETQLAILDNLIYSRYFADLENEDYTIGKILDNEEIYNQIVNNPECFWGANSWAALCQQAKDDPAIRELTIQSVRPAQNESNNMAFFTDPSGEGYAIFAGTAADEWIPDVDASWNPDRLGKIETLAWFDGLFESGKATGMVTVSGHSDGGNDAGYVLIVSKFNSQIRSCLGLDAQGYGDSFFSKYSGKIKIAEASGKMLNISNNNDLVHSFLRPIGEQRYITGGKVWMDGIYNNLVAAGLIGLGAGGIHMNGLDILGVEMPSLLSSAISHNPQSMFKIVDGKLKLIDEYTGESDNLKMLRPIVNTFTGAAVWSGSARHLYAAIMTPSADIRRDFSDAKRQELLGLVRSIRQEEWFDIAQWDCFYSIQKGAHDLVPGLLGTFSQVKDYDRKILDINNANESKINAIFDQVYRLDASYAKSVSASTAELGDVAKKIKAIADGIG
jgi:hypothetical protein